MRRKIAAKLPKKLRSLPRYFENQKQAASILGVEDRDLKKWKAVGCPAFRQDRIYRAELLAWIEENGKRASLEPRDWKDYEAQLRCAKLEREIARADGQLLVAVELETILGATFVAIQNKLTQFPSRVARFMVMRRDETEAENALRDEMDAVLADVHAFDHIETEINATLSDESLSRETRDAFAKILRGIGRRAMTKRETLTATAQASDENEENPAARVPGKKNPQRGRSARLAEVYDSKAPRAGKKLTQAPRSK
jgi:hypothetical protein